MTGMTRVSIVSVRRVVYRTVKSIASDFEALTICAIVVYRTMRNLSHLPARCPLPLSIEGYRRQGTNSEAESLPRSFQAKLARLS